MKNILYCGKIDNKLLNQTVTFYGWVKNIRKLGSLIFMDIYDRYGQIQVVVESSNKFFDQIYHTPIQSIVKITGIVSKRKNINKNLINGDVEINLTDYHLDSIAKTLPISIDDNSNVNENIRLKYRYLDLRRPIMQKNLILRSKVLHCIRQFFHDLDFIEIETPTLSKATPEGARDYLVPTRNSVNNFYALPQSPQIYKQLLMVSGMLKYFQIARCYRDEDLRADRQPEFTQLDVEMSFIDEIHIQTIIENMMQKIFKNIFNINLQIPFERMEYDIAMNKYGSDKPDLRFNLQLNEGNDFFTNTSFKIFKNILNQHKVIKYIIIDKFISKEDNEILRKYAKDNKAFDLITLEYKNNKLKGLLKNAIEKNIIANIFTQHKIMEGTIFLIADTLEITNQALGAVRNQLGTILNLKDPNKYAFVWITDWPLYEFNEQENRYVAAHHPFTAPAVECVNDFDTNYKNAKARAYDIVLNGFEIGGGSIRINNPIIQQRMFKAIGLNQEQINKQFGFLMEAFSYGTPIHGGIALGIDRFMMLLTNTNTIRDTIAFPKDSHNSDPMMDAPTSVNKKVLDELHLQIKKM